MKIAFFGSSLVASSRSAPYCRGLLRALAERGHRITFYEPDAFDRQLQRDIDDPDWARIIVYSAKSSDAALRALEHARGSDLVVKASDAGMFDELLDEEVLGLRDAGTLVAFWDFDAPATLDRLDVDPGDRFHALIGQYDLVFTCGGGRRVVDKYLALGARTCVPLYNALDPATHHPVAPDPRFSATLALLANRLPDREERVREFFFTPAVELANETFLLGGSGWDDRRPAAANVRVLGHVATADHNALNCTPKAILNVNRAGMARYGYSPPLRIFEAAGAGACIISDRWEGIEDFLEPGAEVLRADDGEHVAGILELLTAEHAREIGAAARRRILAQHTYAHRAAQFDAVMEGMDAARIEPAPEVFTRDVQ
jgi:spore maturation protein CgeB